MPNAPETIVPRTSRWNFAERERLLYESAAEQIPTWRLVNQARRVLADVVHTLSQRIDIEPNTMIATLDAPSATRVASVQLGVLLTRSVSSTLVLVSSGYEQEAFAPARISLEALFRGRQILDDPSGNAARGLLEGRPQLSLKQLANRYGDKREIELLDRFSHADVRTLLLLSPSVRSGVTSAEPEVDVLPRRGVVWPGTQLYTAAHTATGFAVLTVEVFGVALQIPPWLAAQLKHLKDNPLPDLI